MGHCPSDAGGLAGDFESLRPRIGRNRGEAQCGIGRMSDALRSGEEEAGAGKSSVLQRFARGCSPRAEEYHGGSEPISRPPRLCHADRSGAAALNDSAAGARYGTAPRAHFRRNNSSAQPSRSRASRGFRSSVAAGVSPALLTAATRSPHHAMGHAFRKTKPIFQIPT
jgi:hypothetical protein